MSGATAFLALILDWSAAIPQVNLLRDRLRSRRSQVHSIPHIMHIAERAKLASHG
jgi:hypothetical protein